MVARVKRKLEKKKGSKVIKKRNALARSRTGGSTMATSNFTAKPLTLLIVFSMDHT